MTEKQTESGADRTTDQSRSRWERRTFLAIGGGVGATLFAGCTSDSLPGDDPDDGSEDDPDDDSSGESNFRLLVSDRPADIDDFDSLEVTFDSARVFQSGGEGEVEDEEEGEGSDEEADESGDADDAEAEDEPAEGSYDEDESGEDENEDDAGEKTDDEDEAGEEDAEGDDEADESEEDDDGEDGAEDDDGDDEGSRGFSTFDLDEPTVDLTEVVGEKAMAVTEGELDEGTYQKLELHVSDVEGIVDGEEAEVKVPSEKLQLTKPFEIREGGSVEFVFDINVVKRGNEESYNLKPVISKSGVVGEDLDEHEVVNEDDELEENEDDESEDDESEDDESEDAEGQENTENDDAGEDDDGGDAEGEGTETESDGDHENDGDDKDDSAGETDEE